MLDPPPSALSAEDALHLYQRLLERDPVARPEFAAAFLDPLIAWLKWVHPRADPTACEEAAGQAILSFLNNLAGYDPERLGVEAFLRTAARCDLLNLLRKEQRHQKHRRSWNCVEQDAEEGKYLGRDEDPSLPLQIEEARRQQAPPKARGRALTEVERRVWEEMRQGEHRHSVFAEILGVTHLPLDEQERQVKRVKDRLKARQKRAGGKRG